MTEVQLAAEVAEVRGPWSSPPGSHNAHFDQPFGVLTAVSGVIL